MNSKLLGDKVVLRPFDVVDAPLLAEILSEPEVRYWWPTPVTNEEVVKSFDGQLVIEHEGAVVGGLQVHEETDKSYPNVSFDIFVSSGVRGQGIGPDALRTAIRHQITRGHHLFLIDPRKDNAAAVRAYEKIGFKPVGTIRQYEVLPGGGRADALLMDLIAEELK